MQIGPSVNFANTAIRSGAQIPANPQNNGRPPETQNNSSSPQKKIDVSELIQVAEQSAKEQARLYTMDRDLPLRGQEALSTYLTNAQYSIQASATQLVGVDIYV